MRHCAALSDPFILMGVLNVTPDSFFDGGRRDTVDAAVAHALLLAAEGAAIIDVGGESTRPGSAAVGPDTEIARTIPVIRALREQSTALISIDTTKAAVAAAALDAGADIVNDVSAGRFDAHMAPLVAERGCDVVLMHSRGTPSTMQVDPLYADPMSEVRKELVASVKAFRAAGVDPARIILDPGIGFAKRLHDNLDILRRLGELVAEGYPVLLGTSRKSFIGALTGASPEGRLNGTLASIVCGLFSGVRFFRVHDVAASRECLTVARAIRGEV